MLARLIVFSHGLSGSFALQKPQGLAISSSGSMRMTKAQPQAHTESSEQEHVLEEKRHRQLKEQSEELAAKLSKAKADEAMHHDIHGKKQRKPSRHNLLKDLARIATVMKPSSNCTTMRTLESGWCEQTCTHGNSAIAKAVGLEAGTCGDKGFSCFLHEIASGIFVRAGDVQFAAVPGAYKPDMKAAECNVHHLLNSAHGMCEELCVGSDPIHDAEKRQLTNGTCNEHGYVKFIGEKRMKAYSTTDSPEAKEIAEENEIADEQAKKEQQA